MHDWVIITSYIYACGHLEATRACTELYMYTVYAKHSRGKIFVVAE